jgi:hypothetical protein
VAERFNNKVILGAIFSAFSRRTKKTCEKYLVDQTRAETGYGDVRSKSNAKCGYGPTYPIPKRINGRYCCISHTSGAETGYIGVILSIL